MAARYTNETGIPLSMAVWLASDYYDYSEAGLSVTTMLRPIKQTILARRVSEEARVEDVANRINSAMGNAFHDSVEKAWTTNHDTALALLGYPKAIRERVLVNPTKEELEAFNSNAKGGKAIPVYMEQRTKREFMGINISGKFDFVGDGRVEDIKSTTVYSYIMGSKDKDYILQGSLYRWLNPELVTKDTMLINFIFTDWQKAMARQQPEKYPQSRIQAKEFKLMSLRETELWVRNRVKTLIDLIDADEDDLPMCSDEELWRSDPVYKYYKNPAKATELGARSTKNFDTEAEALVRLREDGNVGVVKTIPGQVKACAYCPAFTVCKQKDALIASGDLII